MCTHLQHKQLQDARFPTSIPYLVSYRLIVNRTGNRAAFVLSARPTWEPPRLCTCKQMFSSTAQTLESNQAPATFQLESEATLPYVTSPACLWYGSSEVMTVQLSKEDSEVFICAVTNKQLSSNDADTQTTELNTPRFLRWPCFYIQISSSLLNPNPKNGIPEDTVQEVFGLEA